MSGRRWLRTSWRALSRALLLVSLASPAVAQARAAAVDAALDAFGAELARDVAADGVGAITAAVVVGDRIIWARGFGHADRESGAAAAVETVYRIGSISKSVTAVVLMRLVERGVVALDDRVDRWLPEFTQLDGFDARAPITLRQLASHTGGLVREPALPGAAAGPIATWEAKVLASIPTTRVRTTPGTEYSYSNIGYGILGLALSRAAATPFMELVRTDFFQPLGMTSSWFIVPDTAWPLVAKGYANGPGNAVDSDGPAREHAGRGYKVPNGGVYSTVADLARFAALMTGAVQGVLTPASRAAMLTVETPGDKANGYGLGFQIATDEAGRRFAHHGGSVAGYTANLLVQPESRLAVILLRNYNRGQTNLQRASMTVLSALLDARQP